MLPIAESNTCFLRFESLEKLNKIRNQIAHNLTHKGLEDQLNDFTSYIERESRNCSELKKEMQQKPLHTGLGILYNELHVIYQYYKSKTN